MAMAIAARFALLDLRRRPCSPFSSSAAAAAAAAASSGEVLVSDVVSLLTHHRSKSRWSHLRSMCPDGLPPAAFSQIALRLRNNAHLALRFFLFTRRRALCDHDLRSYATTIHVLSRARLKRHAQGLIREALRISPDTKPVGVFEVLVRTYRECDSAPFVFDLLIECCLEAKKVDAALEIARLLRSRGLSPKVATLNSLICSVSRCRGALAGYEIYKEVFGVLNGGNVGNPKGAVRISPNVHTFNTLMTCFYRDGAAERVEEIWDEMVRSSCTPNVHSYSVLMAVYCEDGKVVEAEKIWDEMRVKGIEADVLAYNTIIAGFSESGQIERAEELAREMELNGLESTGVTYEHLIKGYCNVGDVNSALLVYKDMCRKKFGPEPSTIHAMTVALCGQSRVFEALDILRGAGDNSCFLPKGKSYEVLIIRLCLEGKMEEALRLQAEMVGKGFETNLEIYTAFIDGYKKKGNREMVEKLRKEMLDMQQKVD
ncbi:hypothetical protein EUGRSUZ_I01233 [Eucalyptus grandis]|uniref:Uncharacterized protein n=2 Tax=Eucalyptus grandis TaxID=71139 RepID=A0ACC3JF88_EUCGR|nr:hypothetical protein EUGRSUZ_I01233 [Eucalyptus grandis]